MCVCVWASTRLKSIYKLNNGEKGFQSLIRVFLSYYYSINITQHQKYLMNDLEIL